MHRVRVAMDYRPALLSAAGIGRAVRELARALARRDDVELHLFGHSWSAAAHRSTPAGARLHRWRLPGRALPALARVGVDAARLAGGAHVVHWTDYVHPPVRPGVPVVLTVHDLAFAEDPAFHGAQSENLLARTRAAAARASVLITPTQATAAALARHGIRAQAGRLRVVPFGADHAAAPAARPATPAPPTLVAVGTVEPRKGYGNLLRALALLPEPRPRLEVFGAVGWECSADVAALQEADRAGAVRWRRDAGDAELFTALACAAALVYPSRLEGFGFPPVEALTLGTPVVAGATPALQETLGDAAEFCDPASPNSIAAALRRILDDPAHAAELRRRGHARAATLRWDTCAAAYTTAYRTALDGRRAVAPG